MLPSFTVLQATLRAGDLPGLLADLDRLRGHPETAAAAIALYDALNAAAHILSADPAQLAGQLLGRLRADDSPHLARLLAEARGWRGAPWLRPLAATLTAPGTPLIRTIPGERLTQYTDVVVTADGRRVLAGTTVGQVLFWDITNGRRLGTLSGHTQAVMNVALAPDERFASSLGMDGTWRVWDMQSMANRFTRNTHTSVLGIGTHALSPDGRYVLVGADDGVLTLYDTSDGAMVRRFHGHQDIPDFDQYLERRRRRSPDNPVSGPPNYTGLVFTPDGRRALSATTGGTLCVWDVRQGSIQHTWKGSSSFTTSAVVLPDGRRALAGAADGTLALWDLETAALLASVQAHPDFIRDVACSGDGRTAVTSATEPTLKVWTIEGARIELRSSLIGHSADGRGVALDANGKCLVSGASDGTLKVWDLARLPPDPRAIAGTAPLRHAAVSERWYCTVDSTTPERLVRYSGGEPPPELGLHRSPIQALARSADGRWLVSGDEQGIVKIWTPDDLACHATIRTRAPVYGTAISADGRTLLNWTEGTTLLVWDAQQGRRRLKIERYGDNLLAADVSPDGQVIAAVIDGYLLYVWGRGGQEERHAVEYYDGHMSILRMHAGARVALAGTDEGDLLVWDLTNGALLMALSGHSRPITDISIVPDGSRAVSTGDDGTLRLWDLQQGATIASFSAGSALLSGAITNDGTLCIVVDSMGQCHRLRLEVP